MNKYLGLLEFLLTLSYSSTAWNNHGPAFNPRFHRHHNNFRASCGHFGHSGEMTPQHPWHPDQMHHGFGHQPHQFDHQTNFERRDTNFGEQPTNFDDSSNNFGQQDRDLNTGLDRSWQMPNRAFWNGQRWVFPDSDVFTRPQQPTTTTTTTPPRQPPVPWSPEPWPPVTRSPVTMTTAASPSTPPLAVTMCIRSCPVTSEFNPVCGSNNITYTNPGRLECAQNCGVDVRLLSRSACSRPTPAPVTSANDIIITTPSTTTTTVRIVPPIQFDGIDQNGNPDEVPRAPITNLPINTIPSNVLDSIFTKEPTTTTEDSADIDIRHED